MDKNYKENIDVYDPENEVSEVLNSSCYKTKKCATTEEDFNKIPKYFDDQDIVNIEDSDLLMTLPSGFQFKLKKRKIAQISKSTSLLSQPFHNIMEKVFDYNSKFDKKIEPDDQLGPIDKSLILQSESHKLWVDKYAPETFIDLLSDDSGNRMLLKWLKLWDHVVFDKKLPPKSIQFTRKNEEKRKIPFEETILLNSDGRPIHKTVIIHGNPGGGKSTLAKTVAKHCGYEVIEVNSSCDRTTSSFQQILHSCTEMVSAINKAKKPICLILDEIDGVPLASIDVLLSYLSPSRKGKSLKRPIICICNNMFAPSLKKLLPFSLKIKLFQIPSYRLVNRLSQILKSENIKYNEHSLYTLCDKLQCDMRHCINTLQFLSCKNSELSVNDVMKLENTISSTNGDYFKSMNEIFEIPHTEKLNFNENQDESYSLARFQYILNISHKTNDWDHFLIGLFQNYLATNDRSLAINIVARCADYFEYTSTINFFINHTQNYQVTDYQYYAPVFLNFVCANHSKRKELSFPKPFYDCIAAVKCLKHDIKGMSSRLTARTKQFYTMLDFLHLLFPYIYSMMIKYDIRPVSCQSYNSKETYAFNNIIEILTGFSIIIESASALNYNIDNLKFSPDIYDIISFPGLPRLRMLHTILLQNLKEKISFFDLKINQSSVNLKPVSNKKEVSSSAIYHTINEKNVNCDFFGRTIVIKPCPKIQSTQDSISDTFVNKSIIFKYHEGCTDSIKRDVKIKYFTKH